MIVISILFAGVIMVKIPSLDDLKKAGAGFVDQAKAGNFSGMADKIKSGIDSVTVNKGGAVAVGDEAIKSQLQTLQTSIDELTTAQSQQTAALRNLQNNLAALTRTIVASQSPAATTTTTTTTASNDGENKTL
jgi:hypothetical protein